MRDAYDESLLSLDAGMGELFDALRERGVLDDTIVIITSDHGTDPTTPSPRPGSPCGNVRTSSGTPIFPTSAPVSSMATKSTAPTRRRRDTASTAPSC